MTLRKIRFLLAVAVVGLSGLARAELRVVGSDLLGLEFTRAFYAHAGREGVTIALALDGTRSGYDQIRAGRADFGLLVLPPDGEAPPEGTGTAIVGYHVVVVLVPATCPLERITLPQLATVFGGTAPGLPRWSELGITGEWSGLAVVPLAPESGSGLAANFFRSVVLRGGPWRSSVQRYANGPELIARFGAETTPLALAAAAPRNNPAIKTLPVATGVRQPGIAASAETLAAGSYPLRVAVQAVFPQGKRRAVEPLLRFVFSDEAARALELAEIVPLPAAVRAERLREVLAFENAKK